MYSGWNASTYIVFNFYGENPFSNIGLMYVPDQVYNFLQNPFIYY